MSVVKVYCKIETSPWALTLNEPVPEASVWIARFCLAAKIFFWPISEEEQPGDSDVFLHDVVFLIDRHSCVARSTGKVSRGQFFFSQGMLHLGSNHFLIYSFRTNVNDLWGKLRRVRKHHSHPAAPLCWLARKKIFWPIRSGQFKRPGARFDIILQ